MNIIPVTRYSWNGVEFSSKEKAMDHVENLILNHVQNMLNASGAPARATIPAMEYMLKHKAELAMLLGVKVVEVDEEDDE